MICTILGGLAGFLDAFCTDSETCSCKDFTSWSIQGHPNLWKAYGFRAVGFCVLGLQDFVVGSGAANGLLVKITDECSYEVCICGDHK